MNTLPETEFVLVRNKREENAVDAFGQNYSCHVQIVRNNGKFDFSDFRYLRMSNKGSYEEWVHKDELDMYQKAAL